jgi:predicted site-specific integrase-resolvase
MFIPSRKAVKYLGVCSNTLRKWADEGKIQYIRNPAGQRLYNVSSLEQSSPTCKSYCYCRVSSTKQKDDLSRQKEYMQCKFPEHTILTDIGSGINFKRKQFLWLLEQASLGNIKEVVVAHRDRLCRFGFELIEWFFSKYNVKLLVLDDSKSSPQQELVTDLLSILTVFSCRVHGLRKYSNQIKEDKVLPHEGTEETII